MKIQQKPKSFGPVYISVDDEGILKFGESLDKVGQVTPDISSPAVSLLYSLGSCIAISVQMAASKKKIFLQPFHVKVRSEKAEDLPSRFGTFQVWVSDRLTEDKQQAKKLLKLAKSICTVSNTLNAEVYVSLEKTKGYNHENTLLQ